MKSRELLLVLPLSIVALTHSQAATTVEWGSLIPSTIVDSTGETLDSSFTFQLGTFLNDFTPTAGNIFDWAANWAVFDQADYNEELGYFTSSAGIIGNGTSDSGFADDDLGLNFVGRQAYIWVFNSPIPGSGTEWFLASASSWIFPEGNDDCCDPSGNVQWSISDLDSQTPVWGAQLGQIGGGDYEVTSPSYDLQTFTAIPEPSSLFLLGMGACGLILRRRRGMDRSGSRL